MVPHDSADCLGGNALVVDEPSMPWVLRVPDGWSVDTAGANEGALVALADQAETSGFTPNLTLLTATLPEGFTRVSVDEVLADQHQVDAYYRQEMTGYRLIDLTVQHMGLTPEPAVYRLAMYTTAEGVPVTMAQFISRANGQESTLTVTWATADAHWIGNSQAIAYCLERKTRS